MDGPEGVEFSEDWRAKLDALLLLAIADLPPVETVDLIIDFVARPSPAQMKWLTTFGIKLPERGPLKGRCIAANLSSATIREVACLPCVSRLRAQTKLLPSSHRVSERPTRDN
jgi:hypothetical protein